MSESYHDDCACNEYNELSRRQFIAGAAGAMGTTVFAPIFPAWLPQVTLAESAQSSRDVIVSIFLRGGSDGLTLCVPFFDPAYYAGRPTIAIPRPDSSAPNKGIALDNNFAFPQAMAALMPAYQAQQLLVVHATGSIDPSRSHFDAQRFIEVGKPRDPHVATGWLGRHLATTTPMRTNAPLRALGLSSGLAKTLVGAPLTLPIPDPANFAIAGTAGTRVERAAWLRDEFTPSAE
ncbi:MAG: DUF1501 domain-containing protein, partial [Longimicrobiales bacterium]